MSDLSSPNWSPTGGPYAISEAASAAASLERSYRRLVALYPQSFRRESTEEIIAVLLATAREDQRRPSLVEAADLLRGALRMWLGLSKCPRTVLAAVRLMYLGAVAEVVVLVSVLVTAGSISSAARSAALRAAGPHVSLPVTQQLLARVTTTVNAELTGYVVIEVVAIAAWVFLAWANGKGSPYARVGAIIACAFYTAVLSSDLMNGNMSYAPVATTAALVVMAIGIASVVLLVMKQSWPYYARQAAVTR
jgi:hypothetical protein